MLTPKCLNRKKSILNVCTNWISSVVTAVIVFDDVQVVFLVAAVAVAVNKISIYF